MRHCTRILVVVTVILAISVSLMFIARMDREKREIQFLTGLSTTAEDSFCELLLRLRQEGSQYDMLYRRAICTFYALYNGVVFVDDSHNRECPYRREMNYLYAELLAHSEIDADTVEIIITACKAIGNRENASSIAEWFLQAKNSMRK